MRHASRPGRLLALLLCLCLGISGATVRTSAEESGTPALQDAGSQVFYPQDTTRPKPVNFINGDFGTGYSGSTFAFVETLPYRESLGWQTIPTDVSRRPVTNKGYYTIEIQKVGALNDAQGFMRTTAMDDGNQYYGELNANTEGYIYQKVSTVPGTRLYWSFYHAARCSSSSDTRKTDIMDFYLISASNQDYSDPSTLTTPADRGLPAVIRCSDGATGPTKAKWGKYSGVYTVPQGQTETEFGFLSVSSMSGDPTVGNFLDDLELVTGAQLNMTKTSSVDESGYAHVGDTVTYTVDLTNYGELDASGAVWSDVLSDDVSYVPGSLSAVAVNGPAVSATAAYDAQTKAISLQFKTAIQGSRNMETSKTTAEGQTIRVTWQATVQDGAAGSTVYNQAKVAYNDVGYESYNPSGFSNYSNVHHFAVRDAAVQLTAHKTLTGRALRDGEFAFELLDVSGEVELTAQNKLDGTVAFPAISFQEPGTYRYTMREKVPAAPLPGVTYSAAEFPVVVDVVGNADKTLRATVTYPDGAAVFENSYQCEPAVYTPAATKDYFNSALSDGQFQFALHQLSAPEGATVQGDVVAGNAPAAQNGDHATGSITFPEITYEIPGVYTYEITENIPADAGKTIVYSSAVQHLTVTVTDNASGKLSVAATVTGTNDAYDSEAAVFSNYYVRPKVPLVATKKVMQRGADGTIQTGLTPAGKFEFLLQNVKAPYDTKTAVNNTDGTIDFGVLSFSQEGSYTYKLSEKKGTEPGYGYDDTYYFINLEVEKIRTGQGPNKFAYTYTITSVTKADGESVPYDPSNLVFSNTYTLKPTNLSLSGRKTLNGRPMNPGEFQFQVVENGKVASTGTNDGDGDIAFSDITYQTPGIYTYTVSEVIPEADERLPGVTYTLGSYPLTVTVADGGAGELVAVPSYPPDGGLAFTNVYAPTPASVWLSAQKHLEGRTLEAGEFQFQLINNEAVIQTASNDGSGGVAFSALSFSAPGTYYYTMREQAGSAEHVSYSAAVHQITIVVTDDGQGALHATVTQDGTTYAQDTNPDAASFTNYYSETFLGSPLGAVKVLSGKPLEADAFSFQLTPVLIPSAAPAQAVQTVANAADGTAVFDGYDYTVPGRYYYTIREVILEGNQDHILYDSTVYKVTVTVDEDLVATAMMNGALFRMADCKFTNVYSTAYNGFPLGAKKVYEGGALQGGDFSFTLTETTASWAEKAGGLTLTAVNDEQGTVRFPMDRLTYTSAGTYYYKIAETKGSSSSITYDTSVYRVVVTVVEQDGELVATAKLAGSDSLFTTSQATFTNRNRAATGTLTVSKTVVGELADPMKVFPFTVKIGALPASGEFPARWTGSIHSADGNRDGTTVIIGSGTAEVVWLKHGESLTIAGIPVGLSYSVTETGKAGYVTTVATTTRGVTGAKLAKDTVTGTIVSGTITEAYYNTRTAPVETRVNMRIWPFALLLGLGGGGLLLRGRRRRRRAE